MELSALESASKALEESLDFWGLMLLLSTAIVVIGLVVEYWDEVKHFWVLVRWPMARFPWTNLKGLIGGILVTIGVAGELLVSYEASRVEGDLRNIRHQIETKLTQAAGDAATSAKTAHDEADAVGEKADAIDKRLDEASATMGHLEGDVLAQGPRWRLLERGEDSFVSALEPFTGQRVTVVVCGNGDPEREGLEQRLLNLFPKAGWSSPGYTNWRECPIMLSGGNEIYFVSSAGSNEQWVIPRCGRFNDLHDAGNALCDVLNKLRIATMAFQERPMPEDAGVQRARQFFGVGAPNGPAELAYKDPGRIFLLVGPNAPMFGDRRKRTSKSAKPK